MNNLEKKVSEMILNRLGFDDLVPEEVDIDAPLFAANDKEGIGLGLDSVDALEIVVGIRQDFSIKMTESDMPVLKNIRSITEFIQKNNKNIIE